MLRVVAGLLARESAASRDLLQRQETLPWRVASRLSSLSSTEGEQPGSEAHKHSTPPSPVSSSFPEPATRPSNLDQPGASLDKPAGWLKGPHMKQTMRLVDDWVEVEDPETRVRTWRNATTGESVGPGMPKPQTWHQVVDKQSGLLYYWCPDTGETTGLGEPKPGPYGRNPAYSHDDVDQGKPGERKGKKDAAQDEPQPSILGMYNNPLGYMLVGMALFGILFQNMRSG